MKSSTNTLFLRTFLLLHKIKRSVSATWHIFYLCINLIFVFVSCGGVLHHDSSCQRLHKLGLLRHQRPYTTKINSYTFHKYIMSWKYMLQRFLLILFVFSLLLLMFVDNSWCYEWWSDWWAILIWVFFYLKLYKTK